MFVQAFAAARYAHGQEKADAIRSAQRHLAAMEQDKLGEWTATGVGHLMKNQKKKQVITDIVNHTCICI